jgi:hypothetical protein
MKEFFKKHKIAIIATGGILLLLYLFYRYEQDQAANASAAATTTDPYTVGGTPLVYGTDSGSGGGGSTPSGTGAVLGDYTQSTTAQQIPNTSGSGLPTTSPGNQGTNAASPTVTLPSGPGLTAATAQPYNTEPVTASQAAQITNLAKAAVAASPCQYPLNGILTDNGIPACGPQGYQYSGTGGLSTINPDVNGLYPGQAGYAQAVENNLAVIRGDSPGDTQDISNYEALLAAYGGITPGTATEGSVQGAGSNTGAAPATGATPPTRGSMGLAGTPATAAKVGTQVTPNPIAQAAKVGVNKPTGVTLKPVRAPIVQQS